MTKEIFGRIMMIEHMASRKSMKTIRHSLRDLDGAAVESMVMQRDVKFLGTSPIVEQNRTRLAEM